MAITDEDISKLQDGYCVLTITYPDNSEVQCITTLNPDLLSRLDLDYIDGLVDITIRKEIPAELLIENDISIMKGTQLTLSKLDLLFLNGIKEGW
jgi:hypothetical protein